MKARMQIFVVIAIGFSFSLSGCDGAGRSSSSNTLNVGGTFLAEKSDDYVQVVTFEQSQSKISVVSYLSHQLGTTDLMKGVESQLEFTLEGGAIEMIGSTDFEAGTTVYGGSHSFAETSLFTDLDFTLLSSDRIQYSVNVRKKSRAIVRSASGYLVRSDAGSIKKRLEKHVDDFRQKFSVAAVNWWRNEIDQLNRDGCDKHFKSSCAELIRIGFLPADAGHIAQPNQPQQPKGRGGGFQSKELPRDEREMPATPPLPRGSLTEPESFRWDDQPVKIDPPGSTNEKPYPYISVPKSIDAKTIVDAASVTCADPADCPEFVGLLIGSTGSTVFQCSTTYLGHGIFSTNSHCLPENLLSYGSFYKNCRGSIWVKFPTTAKSSAVTVECDSILVGTQRNENHDPFESRDMMFFRVKETVPRAPVQNISWRRGPEMNTPMTIWAIDPAPEKMGLHGIVRKKNCKVNDSRQLGEILRSMKWDYAVSHLSGCSPEIIKGNSGSTMFEIGEDRSLRGYGIVSHTSTDHAGVGMASNYACLGEELTTEGELRTRTMRGCQWITEKARPDLLSSARAIRKVNLAEEVKVATQKVLALWTAFYFQPHFTGVEATADSDGSSVNQGSKVFAGIALTEWTSDLPSLTHLNYTDADGQVHDLDSSAGQALTSKQFVAAALPQCLKRPQLWMEEFRVDSKWNLFSKKAYGPASFQFSIPKLYILNARMNRTDFDQSSIESATIETSSITGPVKDLKIEIKLADYYDSQSNVVSAHPKIEVTIGNSNFSESVDGTTALKEIRRRLQNLDWCAEVQRR